MVPGGLLGVTIPPDWLWMKGSTEQAQYPHHTGTAHAQRQVLPLGQAHVTARHVPRNTFCRQATPTPS